MLVRGPYTLQRIYFFGDGDILDLGGRIYGVAGRYAEAEGDTALYDRILIDYPDAKSVTGRPAVTEEAILASALGGLIEASLKSPVLHVRELLEPDPGHPPPI